MAEKKIYKYDNGATLIYYQQNLNKTTSATIGFKVPLVHKPMSYESIMRYKNVIFYADDQTGDIRVPLIKPGIIHCMEHMLFGNLPDLKTNEIYKIFTKTNTEYNAFTSQNSVAMEFNCISKHANLIFELESKMLLRDFFDKKELEKEKKVIIQELCLDKNKTDTINPLDILESETNLTGEDILGNYEQIIDSITPNEMKRFCRTHFTTQNLVMSIVSDLPFEEIKALCDKYFVEKCADIPESNVNVVPISFELLNDIYLPIEPDSSKSTAKIHFMFRGTNRIEEDEKMSHFESYLMNSFTGKLFEKFRLENPLTYNTYFAPYSLFNLYVKDYVINTSPENVNECIYRFTEILDNIIKNGISQEEFDGFKEMWLNRRERKDNIKYRDSNEMFYSYINDVPINIPNMFEKVRDLTLEEINIYFKNQFSKSPLFFLISGNYDKKTLPYLDEIVAEFRPYDKYSTPLLKNNNSLKQIYEQINKVVNNEMTLEESGIELVSISEEQMEKLEAQKEKDLDSETDEEATENEEETTQTSNDDSDDIIDEESLTLTK